MERQEESTVLAAQPAEVTPEPETRTAAVDMTVRDAMEMLARSGADSVALLDPRSGEVAGVLTRPGTVVRVSTSTPRLGGMATPLGVYLHDGISGGGAGFWGLVSSGVLLAFLGLLAQAASGFVTHVLDTHISQTMRDSVDQVVLSLVTSVILLGLVRMLPLAGTHAAEHQVVHCVEQGVPLTVRYVRKMPRVHPRCGTNLLTGLMIFLSLFVTIFSAMKAEQALDWYAALAALVVAGPVALAHWRRVGAFMQYWLSTKPATDRQIEGAIRAAEQVLERRQGRVNTVIRFRFFRRLWAMGLPQVLLGLGLVYELANLICAHWPSLGAVLEM